jgi:hypothetical protein
MRDVHIEKICAESKPGEFSRAVIRYSYSGAQKLLEEVAKKVEIDPAGNEGSRRFRRSIYQ